MSASASAITAASATASEMNVMRELAISMMLVKEGDNALRPGDNAQVEPDAHAHGAPRVGTQTTTATTRASTCPRDGAGGSDSVPDDSLRLWCGLHGLSQAILLRLQQERFQSPAHLVYLDDRDMRELVDGLAKGEKCSFF